MRPTSSHRFRELVDSAESKEQLMQLLQHFKAAQDDIESRLDIKPEAIEKAIQVHEAGSPHDVYICQLQIVKEANKAVNEQTLTRSAVSKKVGVNHIKQVAHNNIPVYGGERAKLPQQHSWRQGCPPKPDLAKTRTSKRTLKRADGGGVLCHVDIPRNNEQLLLKHWYFGKMCKMYAVDDGDIVDTNQAFYPRIVLDTMGGVSLITASKARDMKCNIKKWPKDQRPEHSLTWFNGASVSCEGTCEALIFCQDSGRYVGVELNVIQDECLPKQQWEVMLGQRVCSEAKLLVDGPGMVASCPCGQGYHTR